MGSTISSKCEFTIYKGVSEHKCEKKKKCKYSTFYVYNESNKTDELSVVDDPEKYTKHRIRVQAVDCDCEKTVRLKVVNQLAKAFNFNPGVVYNYTEKIEINTDYGFAYHLFENTRKIRSQSVMVDSFVGSLLPGTTFYDSGYLKQIAADCSSLLAEQLETPEKEEDHMSNFLKLLRLASDSPKDCVIVNKIMSSIVGPLLIPILVALLSVLPLIRFVNCHILLEPFENCFNNFNVDAL